MKKKMICLILVSFLILSTFTFASSESIKKSFNVNTIGVEIQGNTLITEKIKKRVFEVDTTGKIVWQKAGLDFLSDSERLNNEHTLIAEYGADRIIEIDSAGNVLWEKTGISGPNDVERFENGNTLITETLGSRVFEIDNFGNIIWQKTGLLWPMDAERIENGHTLIAEGLGKRIIEVDTEGNIIRQLTNLSNPVDVEMLPDGTFLITEANAGRVIIVDGWGNIIREIAGLDSPWDAERISNGDILIAEYANHRVFQINPDDEIVWEVTDLEGPVDVERLPNMPPSPPKITGPKVGKMLVPIYYNFTSVDPNADRITYYVIWDDGSTNNWSPWKNSGESYCDNHTWYVPINYTILAKAKDNYGSESDWATFDIIIPRNRAVIEWYKVLFNRFPMLFQILRNFLKAGIHKQSSLIG